MKPKKYKARKINGEVVTGWYVQLHAAVFDKEDPNKLIGFERIHAIFNDECRDRNFWNTIDIATLEEITEFEQNLFENLTDNS